MDNLFAILGFKTSPPPPPEKRILYPIQTPESQKHTINELQRMMDQQQQILQQTFNTALATMNFSKAPKAPPSSDVMASALQIPKQKQKELIIGYRAWIMNPTKLTLHPVAWKEKYRFEPLERMEATCHSNAHTSIDTTAPMKDCECGIYAFKDLETLLSKDNYPYKSNYLIGRVALWGKVIEHTNGYRAQYAYPQLFFKCPEANRFANAWGVEVDSMPAELQKSVDKVLWHEDMLQYHKQWWAVVKELQEKREKEQKTGIVYENGIPILVDANKIKTEYDELVQDWFKWEAGGKIV